MPARTIQGFTDARCSLTVRIFLTGDTAVRTRVLFLVQCTYGCCISTCIVVNFPCECGNMLWKTRRFNMQLMDDACSWCRWPCSMRGLPRLLSTSWATENAVLALFLDPLLLADGFSTPHATPGRLSGALRCSAWWIWTNSRPLAFSANGPFLKRFSVSLSDSLPV